jgi:putative addiction module component (TIGR02574 family)
MPITVQELASQATQLSAEDRSRLADILFASLSEEDSADVDAEWDTEIKRRVDAVHAGTATTSPADEVHAAARKLYQQ